MRNSMIRRTVLTTIALIAMLCIRVQAATPENVIKETIVKHSIEMNVDPALALSIAKKESGFKHELRSSHGAVGVFQLLPSTAKRMGYNPYYLSENVKAGLTYYKMMYKMFGSTELALAAYNAGPGNVKKYGGTIPPYSETKRFVNQIMLEYNKQKSNPDPAITKVKKAQTANATIKTEQIIKEVPVKTNIPQTTEIPEVKQSEPTMEIL
jgi:soluble lytic murein transglycosylase-like protein